MTDRYNQLAVITAEAVMAKLAPILDAFKKDIISYIMKNGAISGSMVQALGSRLSLVEETTAGGTVSVTRTGATKGGAAKKKATTKKAASGAAKPSHLRNDPEFQKKHGTPGIVEATRAAFEGKEKGSDKVGWMNKKIGQAIWNSNDKTKAAIRGELKDVQDSAVEHKPPLPLDSKEDADGEDPPDLDNADPVDDQTVGDDDDFMDALPTGM